MPLNLTLDEAREILSFSLAAYSDIRRQFYRNFYAAVFDFLSGTAGVADLRRRIIDDIEVGWTSVAQQGWQDGGGEGQFSSEAADWLNMRKAAEIGYAETMMVNLVAMLGEEDVEPANEAESRGRGYAATLDYVYARMKVLAADLKMLTFTGVDGIESCRDCRRYKNKRHRARWWVAHDAIPPNRDFECHGYQCQHVLVDDRGRLFTI